MGKFRLKDLILGALITLVYGTKKCGLDIDKNEISRMTKTSVIHKRKNNLNRRCELLIKRLKSHFYGILSSTTGSYIKKNLQRDERAFKYKKTIDTNYSEEH